MEDFKKISANDTKAQQEFKKTTWERWCGYLLIRNADIQRYGTLMDGMVSHFSKGLNQFQKKMENAVEILANHKFDNKKKFGKKFESKQQHVKDDVTVDGSKVTQTSFAQVVCYCCGEKGHKSPKCPSKDKIPRNKWYRSRQSNLMQDDVSAMSGHDEEEHDEEQNEECKDGWCGVQMVFNQSKHMFEDKKDWILLDSGSTIGLFHNEELVKNAENLGPGPRTGLITAAPFCIRPISQRIRQNPQPNLSS